jgi:hypothetical protein
MPVTNDKYDQLKIDRLKHFLQEMSGKGQSRPYEIFVDNLKVVPRTEDPKDFDNYEYYMNEDTEKIRILIYNSNLSPRNDQYNFYIQQNKPEKPNNGLGDLDGIIQEKLNARDKEYELNRLKEELEETKQQLQEAEEYNEKLEQQLAEANTNKYKLGKLDLVGLGTLVLDKFAEKHSDALSKVGLVGLGGTSAQETPETEETQASFQKKTTTSEQQLKPEHLQYIPVLQQLDTAFEKPQLEIVMQVLGKFSEEPVTLNTVAELLNISLIPNKE